MGFGVLVADEVDQLDSELTANAVVGQVENLQVRHVDLAGPPADLERVDPGVKEVAEQLRPRRLLLV